MEIEYIIEICVAIDIAILSISYPIIVDKISNMGEKYSSQYIPVLFNDEFPQKSLKVKVNKKEHSISIFKLTLYLTLLSFLLLIFKSPPLFGWDNWVINNSAKLIVLFFSSIFTVLFFIWLNKVVLYNGKSTSLLTHLINRYDSIKDNDKEIREYHLKAINELTFYAIEKQDEHLQGTLLEFYYKIFAKIRREHNKAQPLIYPIDLYFLINKLNIESANKENKKLRAIEHRAVSGVWLLGEDIQDICISEETYNWLWRNMYAICDNPRLVKMFWAYSNQYFEFKLQIIYQNYDFRQGKNINQQEIDKRNEERDQFLEFHYALGGLLLYRKQYKALIYIFEYSQSQPPKYVLLPQSMTDIFSWFENFKNELNNRRTPIDFKYYFPELDNLGNRRQVNYWICSYISILFIRQYSLHQYYTYQSFTTLPNLPNDVLVLNNWLDSISFFERCLNDVIANKELITELKYDEIVISKRNEFQTFIKDLKEAITNKIGQQKLNAELSDDKINNFYTKSNEIITNGFKAYESIFVAKDEEYVKSELKLSINGTVTLMSKSAFTDNDIPHLNADTILAESIVTNKIKQIIPNSFAISRTKRYLLNRDNILLALSKIIDSIKDVVIIGISIDYLTAEILDKSGFKNQIQYITSAVYDLQNVIFILRKSDLPAIEHIEIKEEEKQELKLVSINNELKLYASVIDINKEENKAVKDKWNLENEPNNLDLKVQLAISFLSIIYWKNNREVIQINIASEYREQGIQNDINDVEPLINDERNISLNPKP